MQTPLRSLTLAAGSFPVQVSKEFEGLTIPWEVQGYQKDFEAALTQGGFFDLSYYSILEVSGPDASDYLQRMSTANFKSYDSKKITHGAFLTGRGNVVSLGFFHQVGDGRFHYLVTASQRQAAFEHIEKFHFAENFEVKDVSPDYALFGLWHPTPDLVRDLGLTAALKPMEVEWRRWSLTDLDLWQDNRRNELYWMKIRRNQATVFLNELKNLGITLLGTRLFEYFRIFAGVPSVGTELTEKDIILEGNFEEAVARNKGCYPGQEVVERIFTYGQVNRKLQRVSLSIEEAPFPACPISFSLNGKPIGEVVSYLQNPMNPNEARGLMFVKKEYWADGTPWLSETRVKAQLIETDSTDPGL